MHDIVDIRKSAILFLEIFQFATEKFCKFYSFQAQNGLYPAAALFDDIGFNATCFLFRQIM